MCVCEKETQLRHLNTETTVRLNPLEPLVAWCINRFNIQKHWHSAYSVLCFVLLWGQLATFSLYDIRRWVFTTDTARVDCSVRIGSFKLHSLRSWKVNGNGAYSVDGQGARKCKVLGRLVVHEGYQHYTINTETKHPNTPASHSRGPPLISVRKLAIISSRGFHQTLQTNYLVASYIWLLPFISDQSINHNCPHNPLHVQ